MKRVLIIDALNMYFRAYIVDPSLSTNGQPIGGVKGFLKILQKLLRLLGALTPPFFRGPLVPKRAPQPS